MSNEEDLKELSRYVYYIDSKHGNYDSRIKSGEAIELDNLNYKILKTEDNTTTGHSLGEYIALYIAAENGFRNVGFNGPDLYNILSPEVKQYRSLRYQNKYLNYSM